MTLYWHSSQNSSLDNYIDNTLAETGLRPFYEARAGHYIENCQGRQTTSSPRSRLSNMNSDFRLHFTKKFTKFVGVDGKKLQFPPPETAYMDPSYLNLDKKNRF